MRSKVKRKRGLQPIKRYEHGGPHDVLGNPIPPASRADTARLVSAGQAQMQELLDQGYIPFGDSAIKNTDTRTDFVRADRGFFADDSILLGEIEDAMLEKPWLAYKMYPPGYSALVADDLDFSRGFFSKYARKVEKFVEDNQRKYFRDRPFSQLKESLEELLENKDQGSFYRVTQNLNRFVDLAKQFPGRNDSMLYTESIKDAVGDIRSYDQKLERLNAVQDFAEIPVFPLDDEGNRRRQTVEEEYGRPIDSSPAKFGGTRSKEDARFYREINRSKNPNPFYAAIGTADPDAIDLDEVEDLLSQGYGPPAVVGPGDAFLGSGMTTLDQAGANITNMGKSAYNMIFGTPAQVIEEDAGDLGKNITVVPGTQVNYVDVPKGKVSKFSNIYPTQARDTRIQKVTFNPVTDQFEPVEGRFYLDRESEGTGAVRRDDLVKTLFNYDITPARKLKFYNEELGDVVSIFAYDSPEMLKAAGLKRSAYDIAKYGDTPQETRQETTGRFNYMAPGSSASVTTPERRKPQNLKSLKARPAGMNVVKNRDLIPTSPIQMPVGRVPIQIGALAQSQRGARQGGQRLDREYYYDPIKRQYREREVDSERLGGPVYGTTKLFDEKQTPGAPVYGGSYEFSKGGRLIKRVRS
jgi:hypothetical protein